MGDDLFDLDVVRDFMMSRNGKVRNHELVTHFKPFLNDPIHRVANRKKFKDFVNQLAAVKLDESGEKVLVLKRKFRDVPVFPSAPSHSGPSSQGGVKSHAPKNKKSRTEKKLLHQDSPLPCALAAESEMSTSKDTTTLSLDSTNMNPDSTGLSVDTTLTQKEPPPATPEAKPAKTGISNMVNAIEALYEAAVTDFSSPGAAAAAAAAGGGAAPDAATSAAEADEGKQSDAASPLEDIAESAEPDTSSLGQAAESAVPDEAAPASEVLKEQSPQQEETASPPAMEASTDSSSKESTPEQDTPSGAEVEEEVVSPSFSVKQQAQKLNRIASQTDMPKQMDQSSKNGNRQAQMKKDDDDGSTASGEMISAPPPPVQHHAVKHHHPSMLEPLEKEWLVTASTSDYHAMHKMLNKNQHLACLKDFISGYTAIHWAAKHGRPEVIKMLCGAGATNHVNTRSHGGYTPLHLAAMHGHEDVIELLTKTYNANVNLRDYSGKRPKQYLKYSASNRAQQLLQSHRLGSSSGGSNFTRTGSYSAKIKKSGYFGIQISPAMRHSWVASDSTDRVSRSPSVSPSASPRLQRKGSLPKDLNLMPPPQGAAPRRKGKRRRKGNKENEMESSGGESSDSRSGSQVDLTAPVPVFLPSESAV